MIRRLKQLVACVLVLVMACSGTALATETNETNTSETVTFSDVQKHWAKTYIEDMASAGMFTGYDDGTFGPENKLTTAEALVLCARVAEKVYRLTDNMTTAMNTACSEDIKQLLNGEYSWFYDECSVCLELGILEWSDLQSLVANNSLGQPLTKEWFSVYLVRAMGCGEKAENQDSSSLDYADFKNIDSKCVPYVGLLKETGIVEGDTHNNFGPQLSLTRAVCATMISRDLHYIQIETGFYPQIPAKYLSDCDCGVISSIENDSSGDRIITLSNSDTANTVVKLYFEDEIYDNGGNRIGEVCDLVVGDYVRYWEDDGVTRVVPVKDQHNFTGTVTALSMVSVSVKSEDGTVTTVAMDRLTKVATPDDNGGVDIINLDAGYTNASCLVDSEGNVLTVTFSGGTYQECGLLSSIETKSDGSHVLGVAGFDGAVQDVIAPASATILVNGANGSLKDAYEGRYIVLYREYGDDSIAKISVDTVDTYIQGAVKTVTTTTTPYSISVSNLVTGKVTTYQVPSDTTTTFNGDSIQSAAITVGSYITARVSGTGSLDWISTWPGTLEYTGTLTEITYGYPITTLKLTDANGVVKSFELDMSAPPTFQRDNAASTISKLITGDQLSVTVKYNEVTLIASASQKANIAGVVQSNTLTLDGSVVVLKLTDGTTATYTVTDSTAITQAGSAVSRTNIQPGSTVAMVVVDNRVASVQITEAATSTSKLEGTVYLLDVTNKTLTLLVTDSLGVSSLVTVNIPTTAKILDENGNTLSLAKIAIGDSLEIRGSYSAQTFVATIVIVLGS